MSPSPLLLILRAIAARKSWYSYKCLE